jgi:hypothetical protein
MVRLEQMVSWCAFGGRKSRRMFVMRSMASRRSAWPIAHKKAGCRQPAIRPAVPRRQ